MILCVSPSSRSKTPIACQNRPVQPLILKTNSNEAEEKPMGEFFAELWSFMRERKKFWLLPIIVVLLFLGSLIVLTQGSAVAPFIYTLF
jgi:hypothetical protein